MAEPAKKRQRRPLSEEGRKKKQESDRHRAQKRINLGNAFAGWRELKEKEGCKLDADLAILLLDFYNRWQTSTPSKAQTRPPTLPVSSITEESDQDKCEANQDLGVEPLPDESEVVALETSMHSMSIAEDHPPDSPDEGETSHFKDTIKEVVTDAHPQITALLHPVRGKYKGIQHSLDIWHAAKSLSKKLRRVGTKKKQKEIIVWTKDIVNHFWYWSKQAQTEEHFKMMWSGVIHHVCNKHTWATGSCEHEPLAEESQDKPWIKPGSEAHRVLTEVVFEKRWLTQVKKFINFRPARNKEGQKMYRKSYNKKSTTWSAYEMKEKKTYSYIPEIQKAILAVRLQSATTHRRTSEGTCVPGGYWSKKT
uniref:Uncharacterized protein n=1 Tax=Knipowitschia caucasica TaxID=637954 RepID=A0AAV2M106_KNICA